MFEYIKLWWKVHKLKKALWNQVRIDSMDNRKYVAKKPGYWKKNGITLWR